MRPAEDGGRSCDMAPPRTAASRRLAASLLATLGAVAFILTPPADARAAAAPVPRWKQPNATARDTSAAYRLPGDTLPAAYRVTLTSHLGEEQPFLFEGHVSIDVSVVRATDVITLHSDGLQINSATVTRAGDGEGDGVTQIDSSIDASQDDRHFLYIRLAEQVAAGTQLLLEISFQGELRTDMYGFYSSYYVEAGVTKWLATTQFQATYARRALPCYDEPAIRAPFSFSFSLPAGYSALFNTRPFTRWTDESGRQLVVFETTPAMSSYLLAFVISEFQQSPHELGGVWSRPEVVSHGEYAASITGPTIAAMEAFVGVPYQTGSISKLDNVAIPDFSAGAMENWGLLTYRERLILWEQGVSDEYNKQRLATVVAHEVAHQWFGDLVSPRWWDVLWINEGFATFFEFFATHQVETTWKLDEQFVVRAVQNALSYDSSGSSHAMTSAVASPAEVSAHFSTVSYDKGGSVIRMMEHALGSSIFYDGLHRYIEAHALGVGSDELLLASLEEALSAAPEQPPLPEGRSFSEAMRTWIQQPGYPLITVTRDYQAAEVSVLQSRFLIAGDSSADGSSWDVPLTFTSSAQPDFSSTSTRQWLLAGQGPARLLDVSLGADDWILLNVQQVGFYRVSYDEQNWRLLAQQLEASPQVVGVVNRAQLLDDALHLARAGLLHYGLALDVTRFLASEADYAPWYSALAAFQYLDTRFKESAEHRLLQLYLASLLENISSQLGYMELPDENHVTRLHRTLISTWQCSIGVQGCLDNARQELEKLMADETYLVGPDMKSVVYCYGVRQAADRAPWDFLWERYSRAQTATEQSTILAALGCTADQQLLHEYLMKTITDNSGIRSQDSSTVFSSTYGTSQGIDAALNFLSSNFDMIKQYYGGLNIINTVVSGIAARLTTPEQLQKLSTFVDENEEGFNSATLQSVRASLSAAQANMEWANTHRDTIRIWLEVQVNAETTQTTTDDLSSPELTESPSQTDGTDYPTWETPSSELTVAPTAEPTTSEPTANPPDESATSEPTVVPTEDPTTSEPTAGPTEEPATSKPTVVPTEDPTTPEPTAGPTEEPATSEPTVVPTEDPTTSEPTAGPTEDPTTSVPTADPTEEPATSEPTIAPEDPTTSEPTASPTVEPATSGPTVVPTEDPTTSEPTVVPTEDPATLEPTVDPTGDPATSEPTVVPTEDPTTPESTADSTEEPVTLDPTVEPTSLHTNDPSTLEPTEGPLPPETPETTPSETTEVSTTVSPGGGSTHVSPSLMLTLVAIMLLSILKF